MTHDLLLESIGRHVILSDAEKAQLKEAFIPRKLKKGQFLVFEGAVCRNQIFINEGSAVTYFIDSEAREHIIQLGIEGWWIGDLQSYFHQTPATCNVKVLENTEVLECPYERVQELYESIPKFERFHRIISQLGYIAFQQRVLQNLSMNAEDRYIMFKQKFPKLELRLPQKIIASYLGMTPEFMSKLRKKLNQAAGS